MNCIQCAFRKCQNIVKNEPERVAYLILKWSHMWTQTEFRHNCISHALTHKWKDANKRTSPLFQLVQWPNSRCCTVCCCRCWFFRMQLQPAWNSNVSHVVVECVSHLKCRRQMQTWWLYHVFVIFDGKKWR